MDRSIDFLKKHESETPSRFVENAKSWRENKRWLEWSRRIALHLADYMQDMGMTRSRLAEKLGVSPQYVSRLLSGKINFSFKSVAELEEKLEIPLMNV